MDAAVVYERIQPREVGSKAISRVGARASNHCEFRFTALPVGAPYQRDATRLAAAQTRRFHRILSQKLLWAAFLPIFAAGFAHNHFTWAVHFLHPDQAGFHVAKSLHQ